MFIEADDVIHWGFRTTDYGTPPPPERDANNSYYTQSFCNKQNHHLDGPTSDRLVINQYTETDLD